MIKTVSVYDKETIKEISKPLMTKSIVTSGIFTLIMIGLGIFLLIDSIIKGQVFNIVLASVTILFSIYPIYRAYRQNQDNLKTAIKDMGIDKATLTISLVAREKRIEVSTEQNGEVKNSTVLLRNITQVKINKRAIGIYFKDNLYYVLDTDYIEGNKEDFIKLFKKAGVPIKGKIN